MILEKIKALCEKNNVSIAKLERNLGMGNGVIGKWDTSTPRVDKLKQVADYFKVTVDELLRV